MKCLETRINETRPVGYGMIGRLGHPLVFGREQNGPASGHIRRGGGGSCLLISQTFHAWLPSFRPSGTTIRRPCVEARARPREGFGKLSRTGSTTRCYLL